MPIRETDRDHIKQSIPVSETMLGVWSKQGKWGGRWDSNPSQAVRASIRTKDNADP